VAAGSIWPLHPVATFIETAMAGGLETVTSFTRTRLDAWDWYERGCGSRCYKEDLALILIIPALSVSFGLKAAKGVDSNTP
jgi:hypothetical protein